jgi:hypothetical protein
MLEMRRGSQRIKSSEHKSADISPGSAAGRSRKKQASKKLVYASEGEPAAAVGEPAAAVGEPAAAVDSHASKKLVYASEGEPAAAVGEPAAAVVLQVVQSTPKKEEPAAAVEEDAGNAEPAEEDADNVSKGDVAEEQGELAQQVLPVFHPHTRRA